MRRQCLVTFLVVPSLTALAACSGGGSSEGHGRSPTAPSVMTGAASASALPPATRPAEAPAAGRTVLIGLPRGASSSAVPFPPRNESYDFRNALETRYRSGFGRAPGPTFVDVEGDVVWMQEYLRYRVNGCGHAQSATNVTDQILGRAAAPVCGDEPAGAVAFPPRNESLAFRLELEAVYRDRLLRTASASAVDIEGSAVWVQEYLRYRVNRCGHVAAQDKVLSQINGQGIAAVCTSDLSGTWRGTSNYFNAPFVMDLSQTGTRVTGSYRDQHDRGTVAGTIVGDIVALRVELGDTGHLLDGRWDRADIVNGDFRAGGGAGRHSFEMRRQ